MPFKPPSSVKGKALDEWKRLLPYMTENGYTVEENVQLYCSYCQAIALRDECYANIEEIGLLVESRQDTWARNPVTLIIASCNATILEISKRFGFSPKDKNELKQNKEEAGELPGYAQDL